MTSRLEQKTRVLADHYMANHPGVPRQVAKDRVRHVAAVQVAAADLAAAMNRELTPVFRNVRRAGLRLVKQK